MIRTNTDKHNKCRDWTREYNMKTLYLTLQQAEILGNDLIEYAQIMDSSDKFLFKGFKISFGDMLANDMQSDQGFELTPISEFTEIGPDSVI